MRSQRSESDQQKPSGSLGLASSLISLNLIVGNERPSRDQKRPVLAIQPELFALQKPDSKPQILSWLQNLDKSEIYCLFCIENKTRLVNLIIKMYYKLKENKDLVFGLSTDDSEKLQMSLNISDIEKPLEDDFFTRTEKNYPKRKNKEFNNAEKKLLSSLQVCDVMNIFDSLIFAPFMIEKHNDILTLFETISGGRIFSNNINYIYESDNSQIFPFWFNYKEGATLGEWIVASFESHVLSYYMKHLVRSKESLKRNYPIEHQKQIRKYWKGLERAEQEKLIHENMEDLTEYTTNSTKSPVERRKQKLFKMVISLSTNTDKTMDSEVLNGLSEKCIEYMKVHSDSTFIDSLLFPTLEQISSVVRFSMHDIGKMIFRRVNDLNYLKLFNQMEEKDKAKKAEASSKASKKKSSKKSSQKGGPTREKEDSSKDMMISPGGNSALKKSLLLQPNTTATFEEEFQKMSREYMSDRSGWIPSSTSNKEPKKKKANHKKRRSNDFGKQAYSGMTKSIENESQKAQSMRNGDVPDFCSEIKRTMSFTNNVQDDIQTLSNNRTLSTKTDTGLIRSQEVTNIYSRPENEVREEDDLSNYEETYDRKSNRGSVDHNQNSSSVDPRNRNLRTNSIEREVKKKVAQNTRAFKPLQIADIPVGSNKVITTRDKKEAKIVNLYSDNAIQEIMNGSKKVQKTCKKLLTPNSKPKRESFRLDLDKTPISDYPEKKKVSSHTKLEDNLNSPIIQKLVEKTPTKIPEKKPVYSAMMNKIGKWEINELDLIAKEKAVKLNPVTLDFDPNEEMKREINPKIDIKKGFQKYLSGAMTLEQGELFFKNYLNYNINESVSKIKASVNAGEQLRIAAFKRLRSVITQSSKTIKSTLVVYGSWMTGLMTESSDIDICIKRFEILERSEIKAILETLEQNLKQFKWVLDIKGIYTATVPVLKMVLDPRIDYSELHCGIENIEEFKAKFLSLTEEGFNCPSYTGGFRPVSVDITVHDSSMSENVGIRTTQYIQHSLGYFQYLGDLVILFKSYLAALGLNNTYKGGLGSYAICLLIIAYLEYKGRGKRDESISEILSGILQFYGNEFNPSTHGICASYQQEEDTGNPYFEIPNYLLRSGPLVVLDPTQFMIKNITQNAYQIAAIQSEFAKAAGSIIAVKKQFFEELHHEMKEQGGVKKDYFLSYYKKKDRALDTSRNLIEDILHLSRPAQNQEVIQH